MPADGAVESGPPTPAGPAPRTLIGLYLRARMLGRRDDVDASLAEVERTGSVDLESMIDAMFHVAVFRMFRPDDHVRVIRRFVAQVRDRYGKDRIPILAAEALVRSQLGEPDVYVEDLDMEVTITISVLMITHIAATLGLSEADVNQLVTNAERLAEQRGYHPTPVASGVSDSSEGS
jgi:hypothetical protein